jgi:hypothetical protein
MEKLGFFAVHKIIPNMWKYLNLVGEYAESISAQLQKPPKESCHILLLSPEHQIEPTSPNI